MRDSLLRLLDDFETKLEDEKHASNDIHLESYGYGVCDGKIAILRYAIKELKKAIADA